MNEIVSVDGEIVEAPRSGLSLGSIAVTTPEEIVLRATAVAKVLSNVIKEQHLSKNIQGREYVYVTGWSTLGAMLGISARELPEYTRPREDGSYEAAVELARVSDGVVIGRGSAVVGMDECDRDGKLTWGSRPEYARRSMAVTRAAGKAFRLHLAWVMALAGYEGTPAEEMEGLDLEEKRGPSTNAKPKTTPVAAPKPPQPPSKAESGGNGQSQPRANQAPVEPPGRAETFPWKPDAKVSEFGPVEWQTFWPTMQKHTGKTSKDTRMLVHDACQVEHMADCPMTFSEVVNAVDALIDVRTGQAGTEAAK